MVRTCIGCSRKALLPPPAPAGADADALATAVPVPTTDGDVPGDDGAAQSSAGGGGGADPAEGGASFVRDLLEATRRCPLCGNNFVVLV